MKLSIYRRKDLEKSGIRAIRKKLKKNVKKVLTFSLRSYIITLASRIERQNKASQEVKSIGDYPSGCGSAWLERLVWDQEVAGSNPVTPTYAGVVQW